jgi:hypothetical protein
MIQTENNIRENHACVTRVFYIALVNSELDNVVLTFVLRVYWKQTFHNDISEKYIRAIISRFL